MLIRMYRNIIEEVIELNHKTSDSAAVAKHKPLARPNQKNGEDMAKTCVEVSTNSTS
jgi:hypothetical protein